VDVPHLVAMTYEEVAAEAAANAVAILPIGSTEVHGPHLPLDTDTIIAEETARRATRELRARGRHAVIAPTIAFSVTEFARPFPGTVSVAPDVALGLVGASLAMLREAGFRTAVLSNGHLEPAHLDVLERAAKAASTDSFQVAFPNYCRKPLALRLSDEFRSGACHAGRYETSLVLAARPDRVRLDLARALPPFPVSIPEKIREGARDFRDCGADRAYFGDPAAATAEEGEELFSLLVSFVVDAVV